MARRRADIPIVGVHPDGISFEAFSRDCSALAWVHFGNGMFQEQHRKLGCTNIDYSEALDATARHGLRLAD